MTISEKLVIFGAGEMANIAYEYFKYDSEFQVVGFAVDEEYLESDKFCGLPIVSADEMLTRWNRDEVVVFTALSAVRMNKSRKDVYQRLKAHGYNFASYVSSDTFKWHNVKVGENTFIFENNTLQPFCRIGNNCILWSGNHIGHRTTIEDHCFISSHAVISGYCTIGESAYIGVNATVHDRVNVAKGSLIGAAANLSQDTVIDSVYVGNPARKVPNKTASEVSF